MTDTPKSKFMVFYIIPPAVIDDWMKTDPEIRKPAEQKMQTEWQQWASDHASMIVITEAAGKTRSISSTGISDTRNGVVLYSIVEADSQDAAAKAFENHPHLQIPQSSIEVMAIRPMGPM